MKKCGKNIVQFWSICIALALLLSVTDNTYANTSMVSGRFDENNLVSIDDGGLLEFLGYDKENILSSLGITDPVEIYYEVWDGTGGTGEPLFLLHGGLADSQSWYNSREVLSDTFIVIAVDTRGHGQSSYGNRPLTYGVMANDIMALRMELAFARESNYEDWAHPQYYQPFDNINVVGWSDGGIAAINLCINYPYAVNKAVFFGINITYEDGLSVSAKEMIEQTMPPRWLMLPKLRVVRDVYTMWQSESYIYDDTDTNPYMISSKDPFEALKGIKAQTAVLNGLKDQFVEQKEVKKIADTIPGCECIDVEELRHEGPGVNANEDDDSTQADLFNEAILYFLE